ncbi:conserved hypothetical protein [Culex quinquefasciatus]|uniref:Uncharacterized protein n=1 Tax=Culex quinquefasciatus TaxID=7176 RepID=B0W3V3_CULQU|nr:conserved hypothetical protein [Culex quinquefasciatus]|eukprot:XP_001843387.1 conserved hypothetical protein [Culex quinquefasciatus]
MPPSYCSVAGCSNCRSPTCSLYCFPKDDAVKSLLRRRLLAFSGLLAMRPNDETRRRTNGSEKKQFKTASDVRPRRGSHGIEGRKKGQQRTQSFGYLRRYQAHHWELECALLPLIGVVHFVGLSRSVPRLIIDSRLAGWLAGDWVCQASRQLQFAWFLAGSWLSSFQQPVASRRISWSARSDFSVRRSPKAKKNPKRSLIICSLPLPLLSASLSFVRSRRPVSVRGVHARRTVSPEATSCDQRKKNHLLVRNGPAQQRSVKKELVANFLVLGNDNKMGKMSGSHCLVMGCRNRQLLNQTNTRSYFRFPRDLEMFPFSGGNRPNYRTPGGVGTHVTVSGEQRIRKRRSNKGPSAVFGRCKEHKKKPSKLRSDYSRGFRAETFRCPVSPIYNTTPRCLTLAAATPSAYYTFPSTTSTHNHQCGATTTLMMVPDYYDGRTGRSVGHDTATSTPTTKKRRRRRLLLGSAAQSLARSVGGSRAVHQVRSWLDCFDNRVGSGHDTGIAAAAVDDASYWIFSLALITKFSRDSFPPWHTAGCWRRRSWDGVGRWRLPKVELEIPRP